MWSADPGKSLHPFLLSACEPLPLVTLWACSSKTLGNWRGPSAGVEERLKEQCLFILVKRSSRGIYWEPVTTRSDKDDGIKLFTDDTEGTMAQNCPLEGSNCSLGKCSSLEEQCSTGRGYRGSSFYSKSLTWPNASDCLIPSSSLSRSLLYTTFLRLIFSQCLSKIALYR